MECYFDRAFNPSKRKLESSFSDGGQIEILSNSVWKKRICDRFLFLSFSILRKKKKKEIVTPRSRFQR